LIRHKNVAEQARNVVLLLQHEIAHHFPDVDLPPVRAIEEENGSILVEWIFPLFRIGFTFELVAEESGWYLVYKTSSGFSNASGLFLNSELRKIISWLVNFAMMSPIT